MRKGPVNFKKIKYDGIQFRSGLERHTYIELKKYKLYEMYEEEKFQLIDSFDYIQETYEHQGNGKGDYTQRGSKKILGITYTPDFTGKDYIIECKGRPNAAFPNKWKLFKKWMIDTEDSRVLYMPKNQKDVARTIQLIKQKREE